MLHTKTTSNGKWPKNIKSGIFKQPLIRSYSNFKLKLRWPNQSLRMLLSMRFFFMEEDIKIRVVEYLSNHSLDHTQISNWCFCNQTNEEDLLSKTTSKYRKGNISATNDRIIFILKKRVIPPRNHHDIQQVALRENIW